MNISCHRYCYAPPCHYDDDDDIQGGSHHGSYLEHWGPDLGGQGASFITNFTTATTNIIIIITNNNIIVSTIIIIIFMLYR